MGTLAPPVRSPNGWAQLDGRITRTGVFVYSYLKADGSVGELRELRHPDDVFNEKSLRTADMLPITVGHPPTFLDADNARTFAVGASGTALRDGIFVRTPLKVFDRAGNEAIEAGWEELSCGYTCDVVFEAGEFEGERYDARQVNIEYNHVAICERGRAGREVRLRADSESARAELVKLGDAFAVSRRVAAPPTPTNERSDSMSTKKVKLDGFTFEVDENAAAAIEKLMASHTDATTALAAARAEGDGHRARADTAERLLAESKAALAAATDPSRVSKMVADRAELLGVAGAVMGADWRPERKDGAGVVALTDREIKIAVCDKLGETIPAAESDAYVNGVFKALVKSVDASVAANRSVARELAGTTTEDAAPLDPEKAREAMIQRNRTQHLKADAR